MRPLIFWDVKQLCSWLPTFWGQPLSPIFKSAGLFNMGLTGCPEASVTNYQSMPYNIPERVRTSDLTPWCWMADQSAATTLQCCAIKQSISHHFKCVQLPSHWWDL